MSYNIGDKVEVRALVEAKYDDADYRRLIRKCFFKPRTMFYVGYTFKQEGMYREAKPQSHYGGYGDEFDPPYLEVQRTMKVVRVKQGPRSNDQFALFEDVKEVE